MLTTSTPSPFMQQDHGPHPRLLPLQNRQTGPEEVKIWTLVMDLTNPASRETALLELSKKREQYDDLALVLWHSFGLFLLLNRNSCHSPLTSARRLVRYHGGTATGDCVRLSFAITTSIDCPCLEPSLQCPRPAPMRRLPPRHTPTIP